MEVFFREISHRYDGDLNIKETTWYNGHAYLPLRIYDLSFTVKEILIKIHYEFRQSEFSESTNIDGGAFGDRHIFEIKGIYNNIIYGKFNIVETNPILNIFSSKKDKYRVKNKGSQLILNEKAKANLDEIYEYLNVDPEFSPSIQGKPIDDNFEIKFLFNLKRPYIELIQYILDFLLVFDKK